MVSIKRFENMWAMQYLTGGANWVSAASVANTELKMSRTWSCVSMFLSEDLKLDQSGA